VLNNTADLTDVLTRAVQRYQGTFDYWGLYNEPDFDSVWTGSRGEYIDQILKPGADAIHAASPTAKVVGPELSHLGSHQWYYWLKDTLEQAGDKIDIVSHHTYADSRSTHNRRLNGSTRYPNDPDRWEGWSLFPFWIGENPSLREVLEYTGWNGPVWLTETGWNSDKSGGQPWQADRLSEFLEDWFGDSPNEDDWLDKVFIYVMADDPGLDTKGLLAADGSPKLAYYTYADFIAANPVEFTPAAALPYVEDFDDGVADSMEVMSGAWQVNADRYDATAQADSDAVSLLQLAEPLPISYGLHATINATAGGGGYWSNAAVLFDYRSPTDFKFAGGFFGADQWRIGHSDGKKWVTDAWVGDSIGLDRDYQLKLIVVGSEVRLSVDGVTKLTHDFGKPANGGTVGLGTRRAHSRFDDFSVHRVATLPHVEDFDDPMAEFFLPIDGTWQVSDGRYEVTPQVGEDAISLLPVTEPLPISFAVQATVNGSPGGGGYWSNAAVLFDYRSPTDFKFAGGFFGADQWRIGHCDAGKWVTDVWVGESIGVDTDYRLDVVVVGSEVRLSVDGIQKVTHDFGEPVNTGAVGLGTRRARSRFDDFSVHRVATLPYEEPFDDGHAFLVAEGLWEVDAGRYEATPAQKGGRTLSVLQTVDPLPHAIRMEATINASRGGGGLQSNALLIYDYHDRKNYKFAGGFFGANQWRMGRVENGAWHYDTRLDETIEVNADYRVEVVIRNGQATLTVDGMEKLSHDFREPLNDGQIGLGTRTAVSQFDNVVV